MGLDPGDEFIALVKDEEIILKIKEEYVPKNNFIKR
jgi:hypothetical protein